jgi:Skp family chaperone for outer membrane proteins
LENLETLKHNFERSLKMMSDEDSKKRKKERKKERKISHILLTGMAGKQVSQSVRHT